MNAPVMLDSIELADVNLTAIMEREDIYQIRSYRVGRYSVQLHDGRQGVGGSVGEAWAKARAS